MRTFLLLLILPLLSFNNSKVDIQESAPDPEVALGFINSYVEHLNKQFDKQVYKMSLQQWVNQQSNVTEKFKLELNKIIETANQEELSFDPILDAQDFPDKGFELEEINTKTAYVTLRGIDWHDFKVKLKLKQEEGRWLIEAYGVYT